MKHTFSIPDRMNKWYFIFISIYCFFQYPNMLIKFEIFRNEPSFRTGWFLITAVLLLTVALIMAVRNSKVLYIITIVDDTIFFKKTLGSKSWPRQMVTLVVETSSLYRLYSSDKEIGVSKNLISKDLSQYLRSKTSTQASQ